MNTKKKPFVILLADDDRDDQMLTREALDVGEVENELQIVEDGVELLEYLRGEGRFEGNNPWPGLILLDLNMPRKDGRDALAELKNDPLFRVIPVVILTTSTAEIDKLHGYQLGAASYLTKPPTFSELVELMKALGRYWVDFVEFPSLKCIQFE